jgi:hypothetical protein
MEKDCCNMKVTEIENGYCIEITGKNVKEKYAKLMKNCCSDVKSCEEILMKCCSDDDSCIETIQNCCSDEKK